ncbi:hypothetical protein [Planococcus faecalis]|uniref:hypothetical protein n=1 Tax=Planococcus faecalis TaxID=1598147 RepID=UPI0008DAAFFB|nr:hypothetical protein [Planococcus faecalis]OHX52077.1 hypothetical protein BB777_14190 [Planococcus faecalis]
MDEKGDGGDDSDTSKVNEKVLKAEAREKRAVAKEFAIDEGIDPVLFVKFINLKEVELDEDGEPLNLDELLEDLQEGKYAKYFTAAVDDDEDEKEQAAKKKKASYVPGSMQKGNKKKKVDAYSAGAERAKQRHSKGDDK